MRKALLARPVPNLEGCLHRLLKANLRRPFQSPSSICFANDQHCPNGSRSSICTNLIFRGAERPQQGRSRGDVISQSRASSLVKGFGNAALAWLAKRKPC